MSILVAPPKRICTIAETFEVFKSPTKSRTFSGKQIVKGEKVLPGFELLVEAFFQARPSEEVIRQPNVESAPFTEPGYQPRGCASTVFRGQCHCRPVYEDKYL